MAEGAAPSGPAARRLRLPELGYGAANVGNLFRALSDAEAEQILQTAWDSGIRYFDTAPHYGLGLSERRLGRFLSGKPRAEFVVSTKVGRLLVDNPTGADELDLANDFHVPAVRKRQWDFSVRGIRRSVEESLRRMGLDRVDIIYLHDPERSDAGLDAALGSGIEGAAALREEGLVNAIGVGSMSTPALAAAATRAELDLLMVAGRYTLVDQSAASTVLPRCLANNIGLVGASVFNSGVLASARLAPDARYEYGPVPDEIRRRHGEWARLCESFGVPLPAAALQFSLLNRRGGQLPGGVGSVVAGAGRPEQIAQTAAWMRLPIPAALWRSAAERKLLVPLGQPAAERFLAGAS